MLFALKKKVFLEWDEPRPAHPTNIHTWKTQHPLPVSTIFPAEKRAPLLYLAPKENDGIFPGNLIQADLRMNILRMGGTDSPFWLKLQQPSNTFYLTLERAQVHDINPLPSHHIYFRSINLDHMAVSGHVTPQNFIVVSVQ